MPSWLAGAGKILLAVMLIYGAYRWYAGFTPPEIKGLTAASPSPPSTGPTSAVQVAQRPAEPTAEPLPTIRSEPGDEGAGVAAPPLSIAAPPTPEVPAASPESTPIEGPSETERLESKIRAYRAQYGPTKARVESLEREVAELSEKASRSFGGGNSAAVVEADAVQARLSRARNDLVHARAELTAIEERARRDGVGYGQLY